MGDTSTSGGGKSTAVQAPMKTSAPVNKSTVGGGFIKKSKKQSPMTAGDFVFKTPAPKSEARNSWAGAPVNPYPKLTRNDKCGCGSGLKYKACCLK